MSCRHKDTTILKQWRPNKNFGKFKAYGSPKKCTEVCDNCGLIIAKWKPRQC
jgi:hypothetical protein